AKKLEEEEVLEAERILELLNIKDEKKETAKRDNGSDEVQKTSQPDNHNSDKNPSGSEKLA
ncbi:MAG: hypothetical protein GY775_18685, partial [Candidatus Scalindua sp.]|nr:hypothetical protein [Candidatus Scalindua sp.]